MEISFILRAMLRGRFSAIASFTLVCLAVASFAEKPDSIVNKRERTEAFRADKELPANYSDSDVFAAALFLEPLVPTEGEESPEERAALREVINTGTESHGDAALREFVTRFPRSRWKAAMEYNLAANSYRRGYFSRALTHWENAYQASKGSELPQAKALADHSLAELVNMHARLGRIEDMEPLLREAVARNPVGAAQQMLFTSQGALWQMKNNPGICFKCGTYALANVMAASMDAQIPGTRIEPPQIIADAKSPPRGFSLQEVSDLAAKAAFPHSVVRFGTGEKNVPVPSVVHWKLGHFAAILGQKGTFFLVRDPTFPYDKWISKDAILEEASGAFLVPEGKLTSGLVALNREEASIIFGRGYTNDQKPDQTSECDKKSGGDEEKCAMATYSFHTMMVSLHVEDTPVGYQPPFGPAVFTEVSYSERETTQPANLNFSNFGRQWTHNWHGTIEYDFQYSGDSSDPGAYWELSYFDVVLPGGGREGVEANEPDIKSRAKVAGPSNGEVTRTLPDGSRQVYGQETIVYQSDAVHENLYWGWKTAVYRLTKVIDPHGNTVTIQHDQLGRIAKVVDPTGLETVFSYQYSADDYKVTQITDPYGRSAVFAYDSSHRLESITDIIGIQSGFTYASGNLLASLTTPYGTTSFDRSGSGLNRSIEVTDPLGRKERIESRDAAPGISHTVPPSQNPAATTVIDGQSVGFQTATGWYDYRNTFYWSKKAMKMLEGVTDPATRYQNAEVTHWLHTPDNNTSPFPEAIKRPLENWIFFNYPGQSGAVWEGNSGKPSKIARVIEDGSTQLWQRETNVYGKTTREVDPLGRETLLEYAANDTDLVEIRRKTDAGYDILVEATWNSAHLPLTVTGADGKTTSYSWNSRGQIVSMTNAKNETTTWTYDAPTGRLLSIDPPLSGTSDQIILAYDSKGRVASRTAWGYTLQYTYDDMDRLTRVTYPDGTYEEWTYDKLNLAEFKDRAGRSTLYEHNALRETIKVTDPLDRETRLEWCHCGALQKLWDANDNLTRWGYDIQGRLIEKEYADESLWTWTYGHARGLLSRITDARDQKTDFTYALDDRLITKTYEDEVVATPDVTWTWDNRYPRITQMEDPSGVTEFSYRSTGQNGAGLVAGEDMPGPWSPVQYFYDELGRLVKEQFSPTDETIWVYDALGRTASTTSPDSSVQYFYSGTTGLLQQKDYGNGGVALYDYANATGDYRLKNLEVDLPSGFYKLVDIQYDAVGNITSYEQHSNQTAGGRQHVAATFTYDDVGQLTGANLADLMPPSFWQSVYRGSFSWAYDPVGNRTDSTLDQDSVTASFNVLNQVVELEENGQTVSLTYDANGNLESDGEHFYLWDVENRLVGIQYGVDSGERTEFSYDGLGRRVGIREYHGNVLLTERRFQWSGSKLAKSIYQTGIGYPAHYYEEFQAGTTPGTSPTDDGYLIKDNLGSVWGTSDSVGSGNGNAAAYDPWGNSVDTGYDRPDFGYTGHFAHRRSGLVLAFYRAYQPKLGRWLSRDPIGEAGGPNLYGYCLNDPVNLWDPWGLCTGDPNLDRPDVKGAIDEAWDKSISKTKFGIPTQLQKEHAFAIRPDGSLSPIYPLGRFGGTYPGMYQATAGFHTHPRGNGAEITDPFSGGATNDYNMAKKRPEYVITKDLVERINGDGTITPFNRADIGKGPCP